jgi:hypothetical protein
VSQMRTILSKFLGALRCPPEFLGGQVPSRHLSVLMGCQRLASGPVDRCSVGSCCALASVPFVST